MKLKKILIGALVTSMILSNSLTGFAQTKNINTVEENSTITSLSTGNDIFDELSKKFKKMVAGTGEGSNLTKFIYVGSFLGGQKGKIASELVEEFKGNKKSIKNLISYGFDASVVENILNKIYGNKTLILNMAKDSSLDYNTHKAALETLVNDIYLSLPKKVKTELGNFGSDKLVMFKEILKVMIEETIAVQTKNTSTNAIPDRDFVLQESAKTKMKDKLIELKHTGVNDKQCSDIAEMFYDFANVSLSMTEKMLKLDPTNNNAINYGYELIIAANMMKTIPYNPNSGGSGGSGGGGSSTPTTTTPKVDKAVEGANKKVNAVIPDAGKELTKEKTKEVIKLVDKLLDDAAVNIKKSSNPEKVIGLINETMDKVVSALKGKESMKLVEDFVGLVEDALNNPKLSQSKAEEMVIEVLSGTLNSVLNKADLSAEDKNIVKDQALGLIEKVIKSAGTVKIKSSSKVDSTLSFKVSKTTIKNAIANALAAQKSIADSLAGTELSLLANNVEVNVNIELPEVSENEKVSLKLDGDAISALGESGMGLTVKAKGVSFKLPASLMAAAKSGLTIESNPVSDKDKAKLNSTTKNGTATELKTLDLSVTDGKKSINGQVELTFSLADLVGVDLDALMVAVFEDGKWVKLNYEIVDGNVVFTAPHFSIFSLMEFKPTYNDINNIWAKKYIYSLTARGLISGKSDTKFDPNGEITRAEFVTILVNYLNLNDPITVNFKDVEKGQWYSEYVARAAYNGLTAGASNGNFYPNAAINRQDMAVMIVQAFKIRNGYVLAGTADKFADDSSISDAAKLAVYAAKSNGIISGYADKTFGPLKTSTRAEAATMIYKLLEK